MNNIKKTLGLCKKNLSSNQKKKLVVISDSLLSFIKENFGKDNATLFALLQDKVCFGKYLNQDFIFREPTNITKEDIIEVRVFNKKQELYIWRENSELFFRFRKDEECTDLKNTNCEEYLVSNLVLWGSKIKRIKEGFTTIFENRGIEYTVPFEVEKLDSENPLKIKIHTYIEYLNDMQASFYDSRFVSLEGEKDV
jgi:CRISPR-associated protein (TIGR03984 family)